MLMISVAVKFEIAVIPCRASTHLTIPCICALHCTNRARVHVRGVYI